MDETEHFFQSCLLFSVQQQSCAPAKPFQSLLAFVSPALGAGPPHIKDAIVCGVIS